MQKTKHFQKRMSQRAIKETLVEMVLGFGTPLYDGKVRLDRKAIKKVRENLDAFRKLLLEAERKGGVVVVLEDDILITTYQLGH